MTNLFEFTNENKDKVAIYGDVSIDGWGTIKIKYRISDIRITPYRKRKETSISAQIRDRYDYRSLPHTGTERRDYVKREFLKYVSEEQIKKAINYMYEQLQPNDDNIECWII